jgi:phospholipid transport system substrate-binding protein
MRRVYLITFFLLFGWCVMGLAVVIDEAQQLVKTTADRVIARIKVERDVLRADPIRLHGLVDELIVPHFDFVRMSQWVLGKHWRGANTEQKSRFVNEFRKLLIRTYATALLEYSDRKIRYLPVHKDSEAKTVTVKTEVEQPGNKTVPINYRMHVKGNSWKVYDVSVDGVSLVSTYRASFASEIRKSGLDGLINSLAAKNAK